MSAQMNASWWICLVLASFTHYVYGNTNPIKLTHNGPAVLGATVTFTAEVLPDDGKKVQPGTYRFIWEDDAMPHHTHTVKGEFIKTSWNVTYDRSLYHAREYEVEVKVARWLTVFFWDVGSARISLNVTSTLNGEMDLIQNETASNSNYINYHQEVEHRIALSPADAQHLATNWTSIVAYWFLGCNYYGSSNDLVFRYNYTNEDLDQTRVVRALVVASHVNESAVHQLTNNSVDDRPSSLNPELTTINGSKEAEWNEDIPCDDFPIVPMDSNKYYGYFKKTVVPSAPVVIDKINGTNWLENGELLSLNLSCSGSSPFYHCVRFLAGIYNVTGNEKCSQPRQTQNCKISVTRLLSSGSKYTVLFIISNRLSTTVTPFGVTTYSEKYHPQLSVIVVPISCSAVAIVLIIFGIAFYIQSRNRFRIEVADFDFSKNSDTEYKTFRERLRDAMSSAFTRVRDDDYSEEGSSSISSNSSIHNGGGGGSSGRFSSLRNHQHQHRSSATSASAMSPTGVLVSSSSRGAGGSSVSPGKKVRSPHDGLLCDLSDSE